VAWHYQRAKPIFIDLLRCEERPSLEKHDQYNFDSFSSAPWAEYQPSETHVDSRARPALFSDCRLLSIQLLGIFMVREPDLFKPIRKI
jgi:hypothetical protein